MKYNAGDCFICKSGVIRIEKVLKHSYIAIKYYIEFKGFDSYEYLEWQIDKCFKPINPIFIAKVAKLFKLNYSVAKTIGDNSKAKRTRYSIRIFSDGYALQCNKNHSTYTTAMNVWCELGEVIYFSDLEGPHIYKKEYEFLKTKIYELKKELETIWHSIE